MKDIDYNIKNYPYKVIVPWTNMEEVFCVMNSQDAEPLSRKLSEITKWLNEYDIECLKDKPQFTVDSEYIRYFFKQEHDALFFKLTWC